MQSVNKIAHVLIGTPSCRACRLIDFGLVIGPRAIFAASRSGVSISPGNQPGSSTWRRAPMNLLTGLCGVIFAAVIVLLVFWE